MTKEQSMPKYKDGERACPICWEPLPAHQTWPGATYRFCGTPDCVSAVKALKSGRYIGPGEHKCEGAECDKFVPAGRYGSRPAYLTCSAECWHRRSIKGNLLLKCGCGCGLDVLRPCKRKSVTGLVFFSSRHKGDYEIRQYIAEHCGEFRVIFDEYIGGFASIHYRNVSWVRTGLCPFFLFLTQQGIVSLEEVNPKTITDFLVWGPQSGHRNVAHDISPVSVFFKWAILQGYRKAGNPVVGLIHHRRRKHHLPRPLDGNELDMAWMLLLERGNARLRCAAAIAEEAGLRIGEICRLRITDLDLIRQRIFVALPTKTNRERFAFFSDKTKRYYEEWLKVRDPNCGHDYLFHNHQGRPSSVSSLGNEFKRTLCKTCGEKIVNGTGFDKWSTHRLRHTMASNLVSAGADAATVMAAGGWVSYESMAGYARIDSAVARRGYDEAMRRASDQKQSVPLSKVLTPAELLKRREVKAVKETFSHAPERCV